MIYIYYQGDDGDNRTNSNRKWFISFLSPHQNEIIPPCPMVPIMLFIRPRASTGYTEMKAPIDKQKIIDDDGLSMVWLANIATAFMMLFRMNNK